MFIQAGLLFVSSGVLFRLQDVMPQRYNAAANDQRHHRECFKVDYPIGFVQTIEPECEVYAEPR